MNVSRLDTRHPVFWVHRLGAVAVALVLWAFAALGFASGTGFVTVHGTHALGMTGSGATAGQPTTPSSNAVRRWRFPTPNTTP